MLRYILLGLVQALTEFLPVSSSGHLIIAQRLLGMSGQELALSVILHLGTTAALIIFFSKDILRIFMLRDKKLLFLIVIVTVITGAIGVAGKEFFEGLFSSVKLVAVALILTGIILILTRRFMEYKREALGIKDALVLGFAQAIAIIPGISRSGITISTLLFRRVDKEASFKFSFLAAIPSILGAVLLEAKKINFALGLQPANFTAAFISSFLAGFFSLWILKTVLRHAKLHFFGYYCILAAIFTLLYPAAIKPYH